MFSFILRSPGAFTRTYPLKGNPCFTIETEHIGLRMNTQLPAIPNALPSTLVQTVAYTMESEGNKKAARADHMSSGVWIWYNNSPAKIRARCYSLTNLLARGGGGCCPHFPFSGENPEGPDR